MTCGNCAWWKPFAEKPPFFMGECNLFRCRDKEQVHGGSASDLSISVHHDGSWKGDADIFTLHDFGCVKFKVKP